MMETIERLLADIAKMDLDDLRGFWGRRYGAPPPLRSAAIMRMLLAWRIQAEAIGDLDTATRGALARTGSPQAEGRELGMGARFSRHWKGRKVEVIVEEDGFRWNDEVYPSLSAAASAITGSRWNGPRFFGLRDSQ
jgi:hypothetical protein